MFNDDILINKKRAKFFLFILRFLFSFFVINYHNESLCNKAYISFKDTSENLKNPLFRPCFIPFSVLRGLWNGYPCCSFGFLSFRYFSLPIFIAFNFSIIYFEVISYSVCFRNFKVNFIFK